MREYQRLGRVVAGVVALILTWPIAARLGAPAGDSMEVGASQQENQSPFRFSRAYFVENLGQIGNREVAYYATEPLRVGFAERALLIDLHQVNSGGYDLDRIVQDPTDHRVRGVVIRAEFEGANAVQPIGLRELPTKNHFLIGEQADWRTGARSFAAVAYFDLYPGITLVYSLSDAGLKYEF